MRLAIMAAALIAGWGVAADAGGGWETPDGWSQAQRERYWNLLDELRCPVCQNESLASSQADLAGDLRAKVREMIDQGKSDADIKDYLVARYGNFVLYDPPVAPSTWLLWSGPLLLLALGLGIAWAVTHRPCPAPGLTEEEHERARRYLDENGP